MGLWADILAAILGRRRPSPPPPVVTPPTPAPGGATDLLAALLNAERADRRLPPYVRRADIDAFAQAWAENPQVTTANPHGNHLAGVFAAFPGATHAGEIIAPRFPSPSSAVYAWMNELGVVKPHRDEILSIRYTHMGVGVAEHGGQLFWIANFLAFAEGRG